MNNEDKRVVNQFSKKNIAGLVLSIISFVLFALCAVAIISTVIWGIIANEDSSVSGWPFVMAVWMSIIPLFIGIILGIISFVLYFIEKQRTQVRRVFLVLNIISIILMIIGAIFLFIPRHYNYDNNDNKDYNYTDDVGENTNSNENTYPDNDIESNLNINKNIELKNSYEELIVDDNLKIIFTGTLVREDEFSDEGYYEYIANIYLNNKLLKTNFFDNQNDKVIWSENYASNFKIIKVNNVYFLDSYIAKQVDGHYILVFNEDDDILASYYDLH